MMFFRLLLITTSVCICSTGVHGDFIWFTDSNEWHDVTGAPSTIDFTGFQNGTVMTDQYASDGVVFSGTAFIQHGPFWSDGSGLFGNDGIQFTLETPQHAVAVEFLGTIAFGLYLDGQLVQAIESFGNIGLTPKFVGILTDVPFDSVHLYKPSPPHDNNIISIDTLYWGMPIPAPGVLPLLGVALFTIRRKRRLP